MNTAFRRSEVELFIPEKSSYSQGIKRLLFRLNWRQRLARRLSLWLYDWKTEVDCRLRMKAKCERAEEAGRSMDAREWAAINLESVGEDLRTEGDPGRLVQYEDGRILWGQ